MTTIDIECPHCGRVGSVPRDKSHGKLLCPKCSRAFHLNASGKAVAGDPPHAHADHPPEPKRERGPVGSGFEAPKLNLPVLIGSLAALLTVLGVVTFRGALFSPAAEQTVTDQARAVAQAIADDRVEVVKAHALPETEPEAVQFFGKARPLLTELVRDVPGRAMKVDVVVVTLSPDQAKATVVGTYYADHGTTRAAELAAAASLGGLAKPPISLNFFWAKGPKGWKLDGKATAALGMR